MDSHLTANERPYRAVETRGSKRLPCMGPISQMIPREVGPYHLKTNEEIWFWAEDLKPARRTLTLYNGDFADGRPGGEQLISEESPSQICNRGKKDFEQPLQSQTVLLVYCYAISLDCPRIQLRSLKMLAFVWGSSRRQEVSEPWYCCIFAFIGKPSTCIFVRRNSSVALLQHNEIIKSTTLHECMALRCTTQHTAMPSLINGVNRGSYRPDLHVPGHTKTSKSPNQYNSAIWEKITECV